MKQSRFFAVCGVLLALMGPLFAQNSNPATDPNTGTGNSSSNGNADSQNNTRFWEANVGGGNYMVALSTITAVSRHRYVLDGSLIVDEVTVDTSGQSLVRFYYISPVSDDMKGSGVGRSASRIVERGKELVEQAGDRTGSELHNMVVKTYPATTHVKQVEYRVMSAEALGALYTSVKRAWETGKGRVCNVR